MNTITNILAAISVILTTNTFFEYPKKFRQVSCPERLPGCIAIHWDEFPMYNPNTRQQITEIREIVTLRLLSYNRTLELTNHVIWRTNSNQKLSTAWVDIGQTNVVAESLQPWLVVTNSQQWQVLTNGVTHFKLNN